MGSHAWHDLVRRARGAAAALLLLTLMSCAGAPPRDPRPPAGEAAPWGALVPQVGHAGGVTAVAFSSDGRLLASGGAENVVKIWSVDTGALLRDLVGHTASVTAVAFLPRLDHVVSGSKDGTVRVWDARTGELLRTVKGHRGGVTALAISPDGKMALAASAERRVHVWRLDGEGSATVWKAVPPVRAAAFSPDGARVFLAHDEGDVTAWDPTSGRLLEARRQDKKNGRWVDGITALPGGRSLLVAGGRDGLLRWELGGGALEGAWPTGSASVHALSLSPDGTQVIAASTGQLALYDIATGSLLETIGVPGEDAPCVAFSPDGLRAASGGRWSLDLWDLAARRRVRRFGAGVSDVTALALSPDETQLLIAYRNFDIRLWDLGSASVTRGLEAEAGVVIAAHFLDGGRRVIAAIGGQNPDYSGIHVWNAQTGALLEKMAEHADDLTQEISQMLLSPDGKRVFVRRPLATAVEIFDVETGDLEHRFSIDDDLLAIAPDGETLLSSQAGAIRLRKSDTLEVLSALQAHVDDVTSAVYSHDGSLVLSAGKDATVRLWRSADGALVKTYYGHEHPVTAVALSPDDSTVVSGGADGALRVFRREDGALVRAAQGHAGAVTSLAFLSDGRRVLSGSEDGTVRLWRIDDGASLVLLATRSEWATYTPDGYFDASRNGGGLLSVTRGLDAYPVSSVAVRANRPDVFLRRLGLDGPGAPGWEVTAHLRRSGPFDGPSTAGAPAVQIKGVTVSGRTATLELEVSSAVPLQRFNVFVNASPLHGLEGKPASDLGRTEQVELAYGNNEITAYAVDVAGGLGMSPPLVVRSDRWAPPVLRYVGIGAARYRDPTLASPHADQNVGDLGEVLRATAGDDIARAEIATWTNEQATADVVRTLDRRLGDAAPDDVVVVALSGRAEVRGEYPDGLRFLPHDVAAGDPERGVGLAEIDAMLARVKARRKLLLLDVTGPERAAGAEPVGRTRAILRQDRYVFNDLRRRSGAIVVLCSSRGEPCREAPGGSGGLLTQEVRRAFLTGATGREHTNTFSTDELRTYLERRMDDLTNGEQNPLFLGYPGWSFALPVARVPVSAARAP